MKAKLIGAVVAAGLFTMAAVGVRDVFVTIVVYIVRKLCEA